MLTVILAVVASLAVVTIAAKERDSRASVMRRAQIWTPTDTSDRNLLEGPRGPGSFAPGDTVRCKYLDKKLSGNSPKFACQIGSDDEVKVKFGGTNGEVYAELLATRLLWALGFGADRMYRVNVICDGCPREFAGINRPNSEVRFSPALIERKMDGDEWDGEGGSGWSWRELEQVEPAAGGAPRHQRDALTLLAVMLQHTDTKPQQQRILCLERSKGDTACEQPFLMLSDLGLTFGRASRTNANELSGANLAAWQKTPVWRDATGCVGNLARSLTGTLDNPRDQRSRAGLPGRTADPIVRSTASRSLRVRRSHASIARTGTGAFRISVR